MKKMNKRIACTVMAAAMAGTMMTGCGEKLDGTQTVATIGEENVTLGMASYMLRDQQAQTESYMAMFAQSYGMDVSAMSIWEDEAEEGVTYGESTKNDVMDTIKTLYALKAHAEEYDVEITEEDSAKIAEAVSTFMEENTAEAIEELAVSEEDLTTYLELVTIRERMYDPMVADVDTEVSDEEANQTKITLVKVSTEGTETDEEGNTIELTEDEIAAKKELAEEILEAIQKEDDIAAADISTIVSEIDSESASVSTPSFTTSGVEEISVDEAVVDEVLKLEDGELVDKVIEGDGAYYVARLDHMLDEDATESKIQLIISDRESEMYNTLLEEWTEATEMTINEDVWEKVELTNSKSFQYKTEEETEE